MSHSEYQRGYRAAYQEFIDVLRTSDGSHGCGGKCNACQVIRAFIEHGFSRMEALMSNKDYEAFHGILERARLHSNPSSPLYEPDL